MNPQSTNHPIAWVRQQKVAGRLDLSPSFQRKPVWSDAQASYLIDSILNDLPVPEIFLRAQTTSQGERPIEVVDGQQRLKSIIRFFDGDLELEGDHVSEPFRGLKWEQLTDRQKTAFYEFKLAFRELENVSDAEVRDMFRRLNANQESLNDQELRHSQYSGRFIQLVEELADDDWWLANGITTTNQVRRMLDIEFVSELLVGLMSGPLDKKQGLDGFYVDYDEEFPDEDYWRRRFKATRALTERALGGVFAGWRSKTEFYSLFLACGRLVNDGLKLGPEELELAHSRLSAFRTKADQAKKKGVAQEFPKYVTDYAEAVTRASTDIGRRLERINIMEALLLGKRPGS